VNFNTTYNPYTIEVITGPMFSGKSQALLERGMRARCYGGVTVHYFKPSLDVRTDTISSRDGFQAKAILVNKGADLLEHLVVPTEPEMVIIDEAQFFDDSIIVAVQVLKRRGFNVVIAGLGLDYRRNPFGPMGELMAISDTPVVRKYSVCTVLGCYEDGIYTQRLRNDLPDSAYSPTTIVDGVDGSITYTSRCEKHHEIPDYSEYLLKLLLK